MTYNVALHMNLLMSSLVKPHNWSFLRKQESRKIKEKTGFPLKNCGNDGNISNVLLLMNSLVLTNYYASCIIIIVKFRRS